VHKADRDVLGRLASLADRLGHAVLATVGGGRPYTSLVAVARAPGTHTLIFATARKTRKYKNLLGEPRVCLMLDSRTNTRFDYLGAETVSVEGRAQSLRQGKRRDEAVRVLAKRHPALESFAADPATAGTPDSRDRS
jgi:nitroimidazol reductase NimA-like FMN-containing flavoprotein (pyridoxamine 5'-phosphate oxidase superfamily)